jgi:hypothetical protein
MKGTEFPSKTPMLEAMRVTKEVHSIGPVILKCLSQCLTIAFTGEILILLTMAYKITNSSLRMVLTSSWEQSDGQPLVHQTKSWVLNVVAPRCELAMDNLTRNQTPKFMTIETAASLFKGNWQAWAQTKVVTQIFPSKIKLVSKESKRNTVIHLSKSAKKLDAKETRTILLNEHKTIPSNHMPNTSKVYVHTYLLKEVRVEGFGVTKVRCLWMA